MSAADLRERVARALCRVDDGTPYEWPTYLPKADAVIRELEAEVVEWRGQRDQWAGLCVTMERRIKQLDEEAQDYSDRLEKGEFLDQAKNDRIYRLQAKCAELEADRDSWRKQAEAERDAARADAERYRWLRDSAAGQWAHPIVVSQKRQGDQMQYVGPLGFKELDAAIDAARQARK